MHTHFFGELRTKKWLLCIHPFWRATDKKMVVIAPSWTRENESKEDCRNLAFSKNGGAFLIQKV